MIQKIETHITSLSKKGNGVGKFIRPNGITASVEVPFTLPGDRVIASLAGKRKGMYKSYLESIMDASPDRIVPTCVHFGECGGCRWQHLSYSKQLTKKEELIVSLFGDREEMRPLLSAPSIWGYRNKMEFSFSSDAAGHRYLGLMKASGKMRVLNLNECHLVTPWFIEMLTLTRAWWKRQEVTAYRPFSNSGTLRTLTVREGRRTGDRLIMLTISGNPEDALSKEQIKDFVSHVMREINPRGIILRKQHVAKGKPTFFEQEVLCGHDTLRERLLVHCFPTTEPDELMFQIGSTSFFQPNVEQAERIYSIAMQMVGLTKDLIVYDLYCGTGTLGICAAKYVKQVVGIEMVTEAVEDARRNAHNNGLTNYTALAGDVKHIVKDLPVPDVVMVDPPRAGLGPETLNWLGELKPSKILYISCNPHTQVEDVQVLMQKGYRILALQPVDQFPHTYHLENIILLESS